MSTSEILAQLPTLTSAAPLSPEEKRLVDQRVAAYRQNPGASVSWAVAEEEIRKQAGL